MIDKILPIANASIDPWIYYDLLNLIFDELRVIHGDRSMLSQIQKNPGQNYRGLEKSHTGIILIPVEIILLSENEILVLKKLATIRAKNYYMNTQFNNMEKKNISIGFALYGFRWNHGK